MNKLVLKDISKSFFDKKLLENINCTFESGKIYGIMGPNGSGKTVLLRMMCGLIKPTHGAVYFNDQKQKNIMNNVGIVLDNSEFFRDLSGIDNLRLLASIKKEIDDDKILDTLKRLELFEDKDKMVSKYSLGMRQKLTIAQAIMEDIDILLLDEPTNGIDREGIKIVHNEIINQKEKGKIVILTSHNLYDIIHLSDVIYEISHNCLVEVNKDEL